ncbi:hypothetical protein SAMN04487948_104294 [Halogranum amylolyticum]|uniref:Uncharacterized protein n=1 Tax=Halogranum amylolyticum TaxID=660520 RepID=A0A1H8RX22_9EURY|nr:hypothetical protein [Halogranum amylolyticum]SEO70930.1 hypothetical protein SAMN04487948_104294 [Halogranum amylolyticum]
MAPLPVTLTLDADIHDRIEEVRPETESLEAWIDEAVRHRLLEAEADRVEYVGDCSI